LKKTVKKSTARPSAVARKKVAAKKPAAKSASVRKAKKVDPIKKATADLAAAEKLCAALAKKVTVAEKRRDKASARLAALKVKALAKPAKPSLKLVAKAA
jgi:hypothetical protein